MILPVFSLMTRRDRTRPLIVAPGDWISVRGKLAMADLAFMVRNQSAPSAFE
jgi:hypothetical protein